MSERRDRGQLPELVRLRWSMVRSPRTRSGLLLLVGALPALCLAALVAGQVFVPDARRFDLSLLTPSAYLGFLLVAMLAPLFAGGGNELFPPDQLAAYPLSPRTTYLETMLLAPVNIAWVLQVVGLVGLTSAGAPTARGALAAEAVTLAYVATATVVGQTVGWTVVGLRARPSGRALTTAAAVALVAGAGVVVGTGRTVAVLDRSPTVALFASAAAGAYGRWGRWALGLLALAVVGLVAARLGASATAFTLALPPSGGRDAHAPVPRRPWHSPRRLLLAVDHASVWRSAPLRRGLLVLGAMPGVVALLARLSWDSIVMLPGLVAAGAGLLFGVNAFCLDGPGVVWLETLPGRHSIALASKAFVIAETCVVGILVALTAASLRAGALPTSSELAALLCCSVVVVLRVVATCLRLSLDRPHRADLLGPRDTPAPPGTMAAYSARLALSTTTVSILFVAAAQLPDWRVPLFLALPFVLLSVRRLLSAARQWADPAVRADVALRIATG